MPINDTQDDLQWAYRSLWKWNQNIILSNIRNNNKVMKATSSCV